MSESSVQSPTISSIDSNSSSANVTTPLSHEAHEKMKKDLEEALQKIIKLEELLKQKDERLFWLLRFRGSN